MDALYTYLHNFQGTGILEYSTGEVGERVVVEVAGVRVVQGIRKQRSRDKTLAKNYFY